MSQGATTQLATAAQAYAGRLIVGFALATLVAVCASIYLAVSIRRRLRDTIGLAAGLTSAITTGRFDFDLPAQPRDELGAVLDDLATMQAALREKADRDARQDHENGRIRMALDKTQTNVMVADENLNIVYVNDTAEAMFADVESDLRTSLPAFNAKALIGTNIDGFHKNPSHQRELLKNLSSTFTSEIAVGSRLFQIVANPIANGAGQKLGTVVEWLDLTAQREAERVAAENRESELRIARSNARIRQALDKVNANVMLANADHEIVYLNETLQHMFRGVEPELRQHLPSFNVDGLVGTNIDAFHKKPSHQRSLLDGLDSTFRSEITIGTRIFKLIANPVFADDGERIGTVVEWDDCTDEKAIEGEIGAMVTAARAGNLTHRIDVANKTGFFEVLSVGVNELVTVADNVIGDTLRVLSSLARGELTHTIDKDYDGVYGQLKSDANATVEKLREVVMSIQTSANSVALGATELSQGNANLSQRTEQQASSLEETASSMEQMTSSVAQNANNAGQANQLAVHAREQAEAGGAVVTNAVGAMAAISDSSRKISDIIGVIDEIAFQTNLLALNASVEAARAGEQGRGFAVVASEVRNLASRSATAAKEIKELIEDSVSKVDLGSRFVTESGETLEAIINSVKKVTDIVAEIAAASHEQSAGIEEVNKAVMHMDEMTQQNAALVEQAAAASASISDESKALSRLVAFFDVGNAENRAHVGANAGAMSRPTERRAADRPWASNAGPQQKSHYKQDSATADDFAATGTDGSDWDEF